MCIDFTGLNKSCPNDPFTLLRINLVIDSTASSELLCFLNAYSGYHQIKMKDSDQIKTFLTMLYGNYCYITMPFCLKNTGTTYQWCMQCCFDKKIGRNVHVYVDDIAVISKKQGDLIDDLSKTFANLREYQMKLNPTKCVFGVPACKLLGFIVSERGIEVNPEKIKAIQNIERPTCLKTIQRLTGLGRDCQPIYQPARS